MKRQIYLDNSATTRMSNSALAEYARVARDVYGNPSSLHSMGAEAERILNEAKQTLLYTIGDKDAEIIFTSSGSEANNLAIIGHACSKERYRGRGKIITTAGEHASVSSPIEELKRQGFKVAFVPTREGSVDLDILKQELTSDTIMVSVMMVNNETGAVYELPQISRLTKSKCPDALVHVDATQGYMKIPFTRRAIGADLVTVSSHKIGGPKGVGALIVDKNVMKTKGLSPIVFGGGQGLGLRSGTENVSGIAAFAAAAKERHSTLSEDIAKMSSLRDHLIERLANLPELSEISVTLPKHPAPHILNITLPSIKSETMLHFLSSEGILVSSGSACSSHGVRGESALTAFGRSAEEADSSIRISFSHENDISDVDLLVEALAAGLAKLSRIKK